MTTPEFPPLQRIEPHTGLVIDAETWGVAHAYHDVYQRLHLSLLHGWGVAAGLHPSIDSVASAVVVSSGVAVDRDGRIIVVPAEQRISTGVEGAESWITLAFADRRAAGLDSGRVEESFELTLSTQKPLAPAICLGRVSTAGKKPTADRLGRVEISAFRDRSVAVVLASKEAGMHGWHMQGLQNLLESAIHVGIRAEVTRDEAKADVMYVSGAGDQDPSAAATKAVTNAAEGAGALIIDLCKPAQLSAGWKALLDTLASDRGERQAVGLRFPYVFGEAPPGADASGGLMWLPNGIVSLRDYGCAWAGRGDAGALPRTIVRDSIEFGINLLASARQS
jgi:hypothetical protein